MRPAQHGGAFVAASPGRQPSGSAPRSKRGGGGLAAALLGNAAGATAAVLALFLATNSVAWADGVRTTLDEAQVVARALQRNAGVIAARQRAVAAGLPAASAAQWSAPVLKLGTIDALAEINGALPQRRASAGIQWAPPRPGEMDAKRALQRAKAEEAQALAELEEAAVALAARRTYRLLQVLSEQIDLTREADQLGLQLARLGGAPRPSRMRWSNVEALAREERQWADPAREWAVATAHLAHLLQDPGLAKLSPQNLQLGAANDKLATQMVSSAPVPEAELQAIAISSRPEVKAANARCRAVEAESLLRDSNGKLALRDVELSYSSSQEPRRSVLGLQLSISLPTAFSSAGAGSLAVAQRNACSADVAAAQAIVSYEVSQAHLRHQDAVLGMRAMLDYGLPLRNQAVEDIREQRRERRATDTQVLQTELQKVQQRMRAVEQVHELLQSDAALRAAAGETAPSR